MITKKQQKYAIKIKKDTIKEELAKTNFEQISQDYSQQETLKPLDLEALIIGEHPNPFSILGQHKNFSNVEIRVFLPSATHINVIDKYNKNQIGTLNCIDDRGFFLGTIPEETHYLLSVYFKDQPDMAYTFEDPYHFKTILADLDSWLLAEGKHLRPYERLGAHAAIIGDTSGTIFTVWAPNAKRVSVVGDFNFWDGRRHPMRKRQESGIWEIFLPDTQCGQRYKYEILSEQGVCTLKADPYGFSAELRPNTASIISKLPEKVPMTRTRAMANAKNSPISIYEVHLGSWKRTDNGYSWLNYESFAHELIPYVKYMGFTHIELLPITEFPYDGSWGYQPIGLYAPTQRFGTAQQFKILIEAAHNAGLNVILDWVPAHFATDMHGLRQFDGTPLYEYSDPKEGFHQDWNTLIYNFGRNEVRNFLAANALYWLERYGIDALRVDAVASMIYRNYSREDGEWIPNEYGGAENLEAISFLQYTNQVIGKEISGVAIIAEESTDFPKVTHPPENDGLGFHYKWDLGWMNDTLNYMKLDPIYRKHHHNLMTFGMSYAHSENFILPLSHDEVVHGKYSLLNKMPGDTWQKFANLRAYYGFMWAHPGKKLLFMGNEFAQLREWNYNVSLDWHLLEDYEGSSNHIGVQNLVRDLNHLYQNNPPLYQRDYESNGFEWLIVDDHENSIFAILRRDDNDNEIIIVSNFTPITRRNYRVGIISPGNYDEILNTDSSYYGGSNIGNLGTICSDNIPNNNHFHSLNLTIPPLATIFLKKHS